METKTIRKENKERVIEAFAQREAASASQLVRLTGLSVVTVNAVVEELCASGEMERLGVVKGKNGRPCAQYKYVREFRCGIVMYAYGRGEKILLRHLVVNQFGETLDSGGEEYDRLERAHLRQALDGAKKKFPRCGSLVLGFPGVTTGEAAVSSDFPVFLEKGLPTALAREYGMTVELVNDCNAAALGRLSQYGDKYENALGLLFPKRYPPGAGVVLRGELYAGSAGMAGEIGNIPVKYPWAALYEQEEGVIAEQIFQVLFPGVCFLNPQVLFLYGEGITPAVFHRLQDLFCQTGEPRLLPDLRLPESFDEDFCRGLVRILQNRLRAEYYF